MRNNRTIDQLIIHYVEKRQRQTWPLSMAQAVIAIRTAMPTCPLSDRALAEQVASHAIEHGHAISFDLDMLPTARGLQAFHA